MRLKMMTKTAVTMRNAMTGYGSPAFSFVMKYRPIPSSAKTRLRDDGAAEKSAEVQRHDGDERNQRVAECMLHRDALLVEPLRTRGADVVGS